MVRYYVFTLGTHYFACDADQVVNLKDYPARIQRTDGKLAYLLGSVLYEGRRVLIQDLRVRFGYPARVSENTTLLLVRGEKGVLNGFVVDDSIEFVTYPRVNHLSSDSRGDATKLDSFVRGWVHGGCQGCNKSFRVVDFDALALDLPVLMEVLQEPSQG